jgi:hypothetical protein
VTIQIRTKAPVATAKINIVNALYMNDRIDPSYGDRVRKGK